MAATYLNSNGTAPIHFRNNNVELVTIDNLGDLTVPGVQGSGGTLTVAGALTAASFTGNGSGLTNITAANASELGGLPSTAFAQVAANNTFTGTQTMTGTNSLGVLQITNTATSGNAPWVSATTNSTDASAVKGNAAATTGTVNGVFGLTSSVAGFGVKGTSPFMGVYGQSDGASVNGQSFVSLGATAGVWGDTAGSEGASIAVLGTADTGYGGIFLNGSSETPALVAQNMSAATGSPVFETVGYDGNLCIIDVSANLYCSGSIIGDANVDGGARQVSLYAMQAAENWFEDAGSGQLSNGSATITLDATFAQTVNTGMDYHVFLTPNGDCKGLYVSQKSPLSFEVHELGGGTSSIAFDYRIMAKRAGFEKLRLADVTAQHQKLLKQQQLRHEQIEQRRGASSTAGPIAAQTATHPTN
jgi:hypothetical protein